MLKCKCEINGNNSAGDKDNNGAKEAASKEEMEEDQSSRCRKCRQRHSPELSCPIEPLMLQGVFKNIFSLQFAVFIVCFKIAYVFRTGTSSLLFL